MLMNAISTTALCALITLSSAAFTCPEPVNKLANGPSNACCKELTDLKFQYQGTPLYFGKSCKFFSLIYAIVKTHR